MTTESSGRAAAPREGDATVLLDAAGTVLAFTARAPGLLRVAADAAAVAQALAPLTTRLSVGAEPTAFAPAPGCIAEAETLSNGGWVVTLRCAAPEQSSREDLLLEILDSIDASIVAYDADERYVFGNRRFHALYPNHPPDDQLVGRTFESLIRRTLTASIYPEAQAYTDPEGFVARRLAEFRSLDEAPSERQLPTGEWHLLRRTRTRSGLLVTLRVDVTEQKRLQKQLAETSDRLRTVSEAKSRFLAGMSHELRTPLNAIIGFSDMMQEEVFGSLGAPQYAGYARDILHSAQHLLALINDVLDLSKAEAGALPLHPEPIDLADVVAEELRMFEPEARRRQVTLTWRNRPDLPPLTADVRAVRQMLMNLVSNALKFTAGGTVTVSARQRDDGGIDLSVADTGSGIPPEALARVGEPFYQAHDGRRSGPSGTGLGLALVRELMKLHGGSLAIESRVGIGTTASLCFPPPRERQRRTAFG